MENFLQVGKIVKVHGLRGEVKVLNLSDVPERFEQLKWVYVNLDGDRKIFYIEQVRYLRNVVIIKLNGVDDANTATTLVDKYLEVDRKNAIQLQEHTYFICDLVGSQVYDELRGYIGKLTEVMNTGGNDVYVVKTDDNSEVLIPALKSVVKEVDLQNGIIKVVLPEGLL